MTPAVDMLSPVGSDPAVIDQPVDEMVAPPAEPDVVAAMLTVEMAVPELLVNGPGLVTVTVLVMFQVKVVLAAKACESVAVTVAEKVTELPPVVSCGALMVRLVIAEPDTLDWVPGLVTDRLSTFQVRLIDP